MGGLIFYQLWYSGLPEEMQLRDSDAHMSSDMNVMDSKVGLCVDPEQDECSDDHNAVDVHNMECDAQAASDRSINNSPAEQFHQDSIESYMKQSAEIHEHEVNHDNSFIDTSIYFPYGLDTSLVPVHVDHSMLDEYSVYLQKEISKEYHANAVKLLRRALHSTPPVLAALIPLIQILLLGDQVDEALKELEEFCGSLNAVLPFRLRASLLECVGLKQPTELSLSYEDVLKKDPTCSHSLAGLIRLYRNGNYDAESLLEMISLHLDATHASRGVWGELASCLLKLQMMSLSEEDCMSTVQCTNGNESKHACSFPPHAIPKMFMRSDVRKSWRLRCRWWSARHFCKGMYLSEVEEGDWQLLTFKAACASHLYEPKFEYSERVHCDLKDKEDIERDSFLQMHFQNSMKLLENLSRIR